MKLIDIAMKIPAEYRKEILETNMIVSATPDKTNASMIYLATIWQEYVEPGAKITCNLCLDRILYNYRKLQDILIDLEKNSKLLDTL